jgi:hypothetical protein
MWGGSVRTGFRHLGTINATSAGRRASGQVQPPRGAWEVAENTDAVIQAYRESTIALHYYGDSILNSLVDIVAFAVGYAAAMWLPAWISAVGFLAVEAALLLTIRDSLLLNILMLLRPIAAIKSWQMRP